MKIRKIFAFLAVVLPTVFCMQNVSAGPNDSNITYERIDGTYFYIKDNTTGAVDTNHVTKFYMNGKVAFCIEPMVDITTRVYNSTNGLEGSGLSATLRHQIELYGHYGYDYPGHQTNRYWLATQKLIWEATKNVSAKFTTGENGTGSVIDLTAETNEILRLVRHNELRPDFNVDKIEGNIGDTITLTDVNGVLEEFDMTYNGKHKVVKNGNTLTITLNDKIMNTEELTFTRKAYDTQTTILYYQGSSQKLASLRLSDPSRKRIGLQSNGGTIEVDKTGEKLVYENAGYKYNDTKLANVVYAVYADEDIKDVSGTVIYKKYSLVGTITTNENGYGSLGNLHYGKYFIIEGETDPNHIIDTNKYSFELTRDDIKNGKLMESLDFKNFLAKGTLDFTKTDLVNGKTIPNTTVQIFRANDDKLVFTGTTDENGKITITDLPVGVKLYMIEKNPATGYKISDEKIYFEIKENGEIVKANMTNEKIKGTVEITKLDVSTSEPLPNTLIEIYKADTNEKVFSGRTDKDGKLIIKDLEYGNYYFLEKEAPKGYELNPNKMYFSILEDGQIVKCTLTDDKTKEPEIKTVKVPYTSKDDNTYLSSFLLIISGAILLVVTSVALYIHDKKRK